MLRRVSRVQRQLSGNAVDDSAENDDNAGGGDVIALSPTNALHKQLQDDLDRMLLLFPLIKRDAYERYLLLHNVVTQFTSAWSGILFCTLALSLASTVFTYVVVLQYNFDWSSGLALVVETTLFVYPVACLGYANKHVDNILLNFKLAAPDDYVALGDRETWKTFVEENQLYWRVLGVPITDRVLWTYVYSAATVAPVIVAVATSFLGTLVSQKG